MEISIGSIKVTENRRAVDYAKVREIAESMSQVGLINAISVRHVGDDVVLVAGKHRLEAAKSLGWDKIEATVLELDDLGSELAEIDENLMRHELHYIDRGNAIRRRDELLTEMGLRWTSGLNQHTSGGVESTPPKTTRELAADLGVSKSTLLQEKQIATNILPEVQHTIKESDIPKRDALKIARMEPEKQVQIAEKLSSGVATFADAIREVRRDSQQAKADGVSAPPVLDGKFDVVYADPPWRYDFSETTSRDIENQYPTMTLEDIKALDVPSADDCVLFLWATAPKLIEAIEVVKAWGFEYKTCAVWDKEKIGMGYWFRGQHELLLVGTKGKVSPPEPSARVSSVYSEPRGVHSAKPDYYYTLIENMCPGRRYLELFARRKHSESWEVWGNEV